LQDSDRWRSRSRRYSSPFEKRNLIVGLSLLALASRRSSAGSSVISDRAVGLLQLRLCTLIELPPAVECVRKPCRRALGNALGEGLPICCPSRRIGGQLGFDAIENPALRSRRTGSQVGLGKGVGDVLLDRQTGIFQIEDMGDLPVELLARFSQPNRCPPWTTSRATTELAPPEQASWHVHMPA